MTSVEDFLHLKQPVIYLENIEKVNDSRLAPTNGANNLDAAQQIIFSKPRDGSLVRLADSYLELSFTYNTQTPVRNLLMLLILHLRMMLLVKCLILLN